MAKQIPLTLIIDNQDRILGVKQLSKPGDEVVGVEHGGTGRVDLEDDFVLIGNGTSPVLTQAQAIIESDGSVSITSSNPELNKQLIAASNIEVRVDDTKININDIITTDEVLPIDRVGEWFIGRGGWEDATDDLSNYTIGEDGEV